MTKKEIISKAYETFNTFDYPLHFVNTQNSLECEDHEQTLQSCELHDIGPEQVGHMGWSPLPYLLPEALGYLMPRLIEMALNNMPNKDGDPFVIDLIRVMSSMPVENFNPFSTEQKLFIKNVLIDIQKSMMDIIEIEGYHKELEQLIHFFSK